MKCEHGLTSAVCLVCASPKYAKEDGYVLKVDRGRRYWQHKDRGGKVWIDTPPDDVLRSFYSAIDAPTTVVITEAGRRQIGVPPKAPPAPPEEPLPADAPRSDS